MIDQELNDKLNKIGYTTLWLDYGVLTVDYLIEQEQAFDTGNDQNTEHYRYNTFKHYLSSKNKLSDKEFENYLNLAFADTDLYMAGSATADLFNAVDLTAFQFQKLCKTIAYFGEWTDKVVTRQILLRQIRTNKLTDELFKQCMVNGDSIIQEYILNIADSNQLQELVLNGKSKKIRNLAKEKLNMLTHKKIS